ncbi:MAG TPA: DUF805 domain-containing protein [Xanthobacteraceae bacterium]|jgi:uncharacterized membrane protein YhaH (DUF805 family)|nr:DUF805 domain-containing protein [Xanthobacteraceae bacterium]HYQ05756.1 DUF805 domain-containing protein [Xanthobacteraceae bacterium]
MDWAYPFNSFEGRISRQTFWIGMVIVTVAEIFGHLIAEAIQGDRLSAIVDLAFTYPEFAVAVKRAHDRNLPLWLLIVFFGGGALLDLLTVLQLTGDTEQPSLLSLMIAVPFTVLGLALLIELGFRRGTIGPNQYGPDPIASH